MKPKPKTPPAPKRKHILVVDDHPLMREGVTQWIKRAPDLEVCGAAESAARPGPGTRLTPTWCSRTSR